MKQPMLNPQLIAPKYATLSPEGQEVLDDLKAYLEAHPEETHETAIIVFRNFLVMQEQNQVLAAEKGVLQSLLNQLTKHYEQLSKYPERTL